MKKLQKTLKVKLHKMQKVGRLAQLAVLSFVYWKKQRFGFFVFRKSAANHANFNFLLFVQQS